jgi:hypothetical protein
VSSEERRRPPRAASIGPGDSYAPVGFLPGGKRILLVRGCAKEKCHFGLYTVGVAGGHPKRLPHGPDVPLDSYALSPDGKRLAVIIQSRLPGGWARATVLTMSPSGRDRHVVLRSPRYKPRANNVTDVPRYVGWRP